MDDNRHTGLMREVAWRMVPVVVLSLLCIPITIVWRISQPMVHEQLRAASIPAFETVIHQEPDEPASAWVVTIRKR